MATKTDTQIKQDLDDLLLEDTVDAAPWTLARKQRAINRAIRSSWPHFKIPKENATAVTLAANTYIYSLAAITDIEDSGNNVGVLQVLLEPNISTIDWIPLRTVKQNRQGTTWTLYIPESLPLTFAGKKLKLRYYAKVSEFSLWNGTETIPAEFSNYIAYTAAVDLFGLYAQGGSDFNIEDLLKLIPLYTARAQQELSANTVYSMPIWVGVRPERSGLSVHPLMGVGT